MTGRRVLLSLSLLTMGAIGMPPLVEGSQGFGSSTPAMPGVATTTALQPMGFGSPSPILMPRMRQSVSMSYATNGSQSVSQSMYTNEMSWKLSDPLTLHLDLGLLAPMWASGPQSAALREQTPVILPQVGLEWRPSTSTVVSLSVARGPMTASWSDPWSSSVPGYNPP